MASTDSTPMPLASMPINSSKSQSADAVLNARKLYIPDNIHPHHTSGQNAECALRAQTSTLPATLPSDIEALPDDHPKKLAEKAKLQLRLAEATKPQTQDVAGLTEGAETGDSEGKADPSKPPTHFKVPPAYSDVQQDPDYYVNAQLVCLQTEEQDEALWEGMRDQARSIAYIMHPVYTDVPTPYQQNPYMGASVTAGLAQITACFTNMKVAPQLKLWVTFARGDKTLRTDRHEVQQQCQISWLLGSKGSVASYNAAKELEFTNCIRHNTLRGRWVEAEEDGKQHMYLELQFTSDKPICQNMNLEAITAVTPLTRAEQQVFDRINDLARNPGQSVTIRLYPYDRQVKDLRTKIAPLKHDFPAQRLLPTLPIPTNEATNIEAACKVKQFQAYRRSGKPAQDGIQVTFGNMKSRAGLIKDGAPLMAMRPSTRFLDAQHAELALGYGHHLEFAEEQMHLQAIMRKDHVCTIHQVHEYTFVGITCSQKKDSSLDNEFLALPPKTRVTLKVHSNKSPTGHFITSGWTVDMDVDIFPLPQLLVLLTGKRAAVLDSIAQRGLRLGEGADRHAVHVKPDINKTTVTAQIDAVHKAYDPRAQEGSGGNWLGLLLFDGLDMDRFDPFIEVSSEKADEVYDWLLNKTVKWSPSQKKVLRDSRNMLHRVRLVTGSGGSGKTMLSVYLGHAVLKLSPNAKLLYASDRNSVCNNQLLRHVAATPDPDDIPLEERPLRVYVPQAGGFKNIEPDDQVKDRSTFTHETLIILELANSKDEDRRSKKSGMSQYSVDARIKLHIDAGRKFEGFIMDGDKLNDKVHPDGKPIDLFAYVNEAITRLVQWRENRDARGTSATTDTKSDSVDPKKPASKEPESTKFASKKRASKKTNSKKPHGLSNFKKVQFTEPAEKPVTEPIEGVTDGDEATQEGPFTTEEWSLYGKAYQLVYAQVIREARVVVSTVVNCQEGNFRKNFASGADDKVFIEFDEAGTIHEAGALIPLAKCFVDFGGKIVSIGFYGDLKQLGPVSLGSSGQNGAAGYNEFGAQVRKSLFVRLIECGFPVYHLSNQGRMHEAIFAPARTFFYEEDIVSDGQNLELPDGFEPVWREMFGLHSEKLCKVQERVHFISNVGDHARRSLDTGSRANMVNADTILEICRDHLIPFFNKNMRETVCIITGYARQKLLIQQKFQALRESNKQLSEQHMPEVTTIDSSIGREYDMCILDYVASNATSGGLGFMKDNRRMCVAHTRGRTALIIVGGDMSPQEFKTAVASNNQSGDDKQEGSDSKPDGDGANDVTRNNKTSKTKQTAGGTIKIPKYAASWYQQYCSKYDARSINEVKELHEAAWPLDFWDADSKAAFDRVRAIFREVTVNRFGVPTLNSYQRDMIEEARLKIIQEKDKEEAAK